MDRPGGKLREYLACFGILSCNVNPYLPSLSDIGCGWEDVTALVDMRELFFCRVWRSRTTYLSREAYYLLKACRAHRPLIPEVQRLLELLGGGPPLGTDELKRLSGLDGKAYAKGFQLLLEDLRATALENGRPLNPSWSTFLYGTAEAWEAPVEQARERLWAPLGRTMPEKELVRLLRRAV